MNADDAEVIIIGAGFAGLFMLHRLRTLGIPAFILEAGGDVGGTWYWNRYPGARCDVESLQYSYSFSEELQQDWEWTERFASQPEILRYINHVAERFDLRRDIRFNMRVRGMQFDKSSARWAVRTADGQVFTARFCVAATGCLSASNDPAIPGRDSFAGEIYRTAMWPHGPVDLSGKRVGIIGTGSSAIQCIPLLAQQAANLTVFQRTANFSVPARNRPLQQEHVAAWKAAYPEHRRRAREETPSGTLFEFSAFKATDVDHASRQAEYERRWQAGGAGFLHSFNDLLVEEASNHTAAEFVRAKINATVKDPSVAAALTPSGYPLGTKRICVDTDYYETFNRPNVRLVDLRKTPITRIVPAGVVLQDETITLDCLVFATGFDAVTGALDRIEVLGSGEMSLKQAWQGGPKAYLGLMTAGFPNLFMVTGPGSPSVLSNVIVSIEHHVEWIAACLAHMRDEGTQVVEALPSAQEEWADHVRAVAERTLFPRAASWYMGANIPGKPRVFLPYVGGLGNYHRICRRVADDGYTGFAFRTAPPDTTASEPQEETA